MKMVNEWLSELENELSVLLPEDRFDILQSYQEQINELIADGKSEEEVLDSLGWPKIVAKEVLESLEYEQPKDDKKGSLNEQPIKIEEKDQSIKIAGIWQLLVIGSIIVLAIVSMSAFINFIRFLLGGVLLLSLSVGMSIVIFAMAWLSLNVVIASIYGIYLLYKKLLMNKGGNSR